MKSNILLTVSLIILSAIFIGISFSVFITRGKVSYLIGKKLKIGAMIITMTAILSGCAGSRGDGGTIMCYSPAPTNCLSLEDTVVTSGGILKGTISNINVPYFRYSITKNDGENKIEIDKGDILPKDGKFDQNTEDVLINIKKDIPEGEYVLNVYGILDGKEYDLDISHRTITIKK